MRKSVCPNRLEGKRVVSSPARTGPEPRQKTGFVHFELLTYLWELRWVYADKKGRKVGIDVLYDVCLCLRYPRYNRPVYSNKPKDILVNRRYVTSTVRTMLLCHVIYRLSETAGSARLSLVHSSEPDRHELKRRRRRSGRMKNACVDNHRTTPLNKSRSVGCCRSLEAYALPSVSKQHFLALPPLSLSLSLCHLCKFPWPIILPQPQSH